MKIDLRFPFSLLLFLSLLACNNSSKPDDPAPLTLPTLTGISPAAAPVGDQITLTGTNFNPDPALNAVLIGGVPAVVVSATATTLVVTVPAGSANGPVSVTTGGQTVQSATAFTITPRLLKAVVEVQGTTFANLTWTRDKIYLLRGVVYIPADFTLTIEPGTVVKGAGPEQDPLGKNAAGLLVVERRGKLIARGTAAQPIVFTSAKPAGQRKAGDWGGIVLSGKAAINRPGPTPFVGGVRGTVEAYSEFDDNSGVLQYVRIEYAGASSAGATENRLGGLTLYGVGYNTTLDHLQVSHSSGDAFAWFGGTANLKNLVAFRNTGDDWSTDWGYLGNVQFGVSLRDPALADPLGSDGIESQNFDPGENPGGTLTRQNGLPQTAPVFANLSNFAFNTPPTTPGNYGAALNLRRNTAISIYNSVFYGYPEGLRLDGSAAGTLTNATSGALDLKGIVLANVLTPIIGAGDITTEQATTYFTAAGRANQVIAPSELPSLLLNSATFTLAAPNLLLQAGSPLLTGAVTGGKVGPSFFTPVTFRGAFGTDNWLAGWTNFTPQDSDYDR